MASRAEVLRRLWADSVELRVGPDTYLAISQILLSGSDTDLVVTQFQARWILDEWVHRQSLARSACLEVLGVLGHHRNDFSRATDHEIEENLGRAVDEGRLVLVLLPRDQLTAPPRPEPLVIARPRSAPTPTRTFRYPVTVLDDAGKPVRGVNLKFDFDGTPRMTTSNDAGDGTTDWSEDAPATVKVLDLPGLRTRLKDTWQAAPPEIADGAVQRVDAAAVDFAVRSGARTTIVLARPPVWRVRMVGLIFDADKCFLLPQALDGIRSIVSMHKTHPAAKVLIVGHEGGDEVTGGVDLALGRAKILAAYLTSKPDDWLAWFGADKSARQRWGVREVQLMLSALTKKDGRPFYQGSAPGVIDDATAAALKAFQTANGLSADGKAGAATRKALVSRYMALEDTSLTAGVDPVAHGCTGHQDDTLTDDGLQPDDRRLEVLFFDGDIDPAPSGETSDAGSPEYADWHARLAKTVDFENHGIHVQIVDTTKQPVAFATAHLEGPTQADTTADEHGFVTFWGLVAGQYTLTATTKTGRPVTSARITYPTAKTIEGARKVASSDQASSAS